VYLATLESHEEHVYYGNTGLNPEWLDPRFTVLDRNQSYSLVMHNVTVNDSAYYQCVEDYGSGRRHFFGLTVEGKFSFHCSSMDPPSTISQNFSVCISIFNSLIIVNFEWMTYFQYDIVLGCFVVFQFTLTEEFDRTGFFS